MAASNIEFPFGEYWQPMHEYVGFRAMIGKERIDCSVTKKALVKHFKGRGRDPIEVFKANRAAIEEKAGGLIKKRKKSALFEPLALDVGDF